MAVGRWGGGAVAAAAAVVEGVGCAVIVAAFCMVCLDWFVEWGTKLKLIFRK